MSDPVLRPPQGSPHRRWELARGAWGLACLVAPRALLSAVGDPGRDHRAAVTVRVLGGRQLVQAAFSGLRPGPAVLADGAWVDAVHAATAVGLAVASPSRRRLGLLDAAVAATWCSLSVRAARRTAPRPGSPVWTERLSLALQPFLPGASRLGRA